MKRSVLTLACALLAVPVGACADDRSGSDPAARAASNLTVRFTHPREPVVHYRCSSERGEAIPRCDPRKLARLASVLDRQRRRDRVCAELYGGPQRAHLTGTLRGKRVSRHFTRVDGCAIADYDALREVLGSRPPAAGSGESAGIIPPDGGTTRGHGGAPRRVAVPESDASPPAATIVLARAGGGRTLAEASQPPSRPPPGPLRLYQPWLQGTAIGTDDDGGVARIRVSITERVACTGAGGERFTRIRTRYFPPPQIESIRVTPGTRLPTKAKRSLRLTLAGTRCGRGAHAIEVHGELWAEAINGSGLEAVTRHIAFVYRAGSRSR